MGSPCLNAVLCLLEMLGRQPYLQHECDVRVSSVMCFVLKGQPQCRSRDHCFDVCGVNQQPRTVCHAPEKKKKQNCTSFCQPTRPITCANHGNQGRFVVTVMLRQQGRVRAMIASLVMLGARYTTKQDDQVSIFWARIGSHPISLLHSLVHAALLVLMCSKATIHSKPARGVTGAKSFPPFILMNLIMSGS